MIVDPSAPARPEDIGTGKESDRYVTLRDAHGHEFDARTGLVICPEKPFLYQDSLYGRPVERGIPLGHSQCITQDREFVKI